MVAIFTVIQSVYVDRTDIPTAIRLNTYEDPWFDDSTIKQTTRDTTKTLITGDLPTNINTAVRQGVIQLSRTSFIRLVINPFL